MYNGYPVYRKEGSVFLIYMHNPSLKQWVIQPREPSPHWSANAYGYGQSPDTVSWSAVELSVTLVVKFNVTGHRDPGYNGVYDNSTGEMYNGYPVYRKEGTVFLIYMHNPSLMQWVIQPREPSSEWSANAQGFGESPDTASWPANRPLRVTLVDG